MNPCERFDEELLASALSGEVQGEELVRHLGECASCAARWARIRLVARSIVDLPRQAIPSELEGSIVASLHGGYREDRAVSAMRTLARLVPPAELSHAVRATMSDDERAPAVLDRLLAEEIEDAGRSAARRASARLRRVPAPPELVRRLGESLARREPNARRSFFPYGVMAIALAAGVLLVSRLAGVFHDAASSQQGRPLAAIEFRSAESLADLDPFARDLLDQFTGGASFAVPR